MSTMIPGVETDTGLHPHRTVRPPDDLDYLRTVFVNVYFHGQPYAKDREWVLIDSGIPGSARAITAKAVERFGPESRPSAIVLTHGHFDHCGTAAKLAEQWDVPIYAHELEMPYLTGVSPYPPPDPTVGGGLMAELSWLFPRGPFDLGDRVQVLPRDGSVPGMPGWKWIHTPGHAPGHVSLFRDSDRTLIAGDAFTTVKPESVLATIEQRTEIHGPPSYFTPDWDAARESVRRLAALDPQMALTGHGLPMAGEALRTNLRILARDFDRIARPRRGRYVHVPARTDIHGTVSVPPQTSIPISKILVGLGGGLALGLGVAALLPGSRHRHS